MDSSITDRTVQLSTEAKKHFHYMQQKKKRNDLIGGGTLILILTHKKCSNTKVK